MGFLERTGNLIRGLFEKTLGGLEENHADLLLEDVKNKMERARKQAERTLIDIQTNAELSRLDIRKKEQILEGIAVKITMATEKRDEALLTELLILQQQEEADLENLRQTHKEAVENALRVKEQYQLFEQEMRLRQQEIRSLKSKSQIASMKKEICRLEDTYSGAKELQKAERLVHRKKAEADAREQLQAESISCRLQKMDGEAMRERAKERAKLLLRDGSDGEVVSVGEAKA